MNEEVAIYRYVTSGSFDAYMWQALETKARFISQVMTGDNTSRRAEDIGGQELSYAAVKAIASGNPAVLVLAEADAEIQRLAVLKKNHDDEQYLARRNVRTLPDSIKRFSERLTALTNDRATLTSHADHPIIIGNKGCDQENLMDTLGGRLDGLGKVTEPQRVALRVYRGLRSGMLLHPRFSPDLYLEGETTRQTMLSSQGPRAVLNTLNRLAGSNQTECETTRRDLELAQGQLRVYESRLGQVFSHEAYMAELTSLRDRLRIGLSGGDQSVGELAGQIKTLRAGNVVEAAAPRARQQSAEQPVTARAGFRERVLQGRDGVLER